MREKNSGKNEAIKQDYQTNRFRRNSSDDKRGPWKKKKKGYWALQAAEN